MSFLLQNEEFEIIIYRFAPYFLIGMFLEIVLAKHLKTIKL